MARSQFTCGAGGRDEPHMLWLYKRRRNAEEQQETSSCASGSIATRSSLLEILLDRYSHCLFRERRSSFSTPSPSLSPQSYYALRRGGVPSRLDRHGELLTIRKRFLDRLTNGALVSPPGARPRAVLDACMLLKATPTGERSPRTEIPSNRRAAGRPPETGAVTSAREASILRGRTRGRVRVQSVSSE